jgi:hypothetical protein
LKIEEYSSEIWSHVNIVNAYDFTDAYFTYPDDGEEKFLCNVVAYLPN